MEEEEKKIHDQLKAFDHFNVKKYETLLKAKRNLKDKKKLDEFAVKMNALLTSIDKQEFKKYDQDLVKFVCEAIEHIFCKRKCGELKKAIAIEILRPYFDDNEPLIEKFIELMMEKIVHSTMWTRNKNRVYNFFLRLYNTLAKKL